MKTRNHPERYNAKGERIGFYACEHPELAEATCPIGYGECEACRWIEEDYRLDHPHNESPN